MRVKSQTPSGKIERELSTDEVLFLANEGNTEAKKKGRNKKTLEVEVFRNFLIQKVLEEQEPIIQALVDKGKSGDISALKEIFERVLGRVKEQMELSGQVETEVKLNEETTRLLKEFISYREKKI